MKKIFLFIAVAIVVAAASCQSDAAKKTTTDPTLQSQAHQMDTANYTNIQWLDTLVNFGTVPRGEKVKITFKFKNTGNKPLYLSSVRPSCGCTVADYSKGAVLPGEQGKITGEFDSNHGSPGPIHKSILVLSNTKNYPNYSLIFEGEVKENK